MVDRTIPAPLTTDEFNVLVASDRDFFRPNERYIHPVLPPGSPFTSTQLTENAEAVSQQTTANLRDILVHFSHGDVPMGSSVHVVSAMHDAIQEELRMREHLLRELQMTSPSHVNDLSYRILQTPEYSRASTMMHAFGQVFRVSTLASVLAESFGHNRANYAVAPGIKQAFMSMRPRYGAKRGRRFKLLGERSDKEVPIEKIRDKSYD